MNEIECPYCGEENHVNHDDGGGYEEGVAHEMQCDRCQKNFVFNTNISFDYSPGKADCLNGSPHRFGDWIRIWTDNEGNEVMQKTCRDCGHNERRTIEPL